MKAFNENVGDCLAAGQRDLGLWDERLTTRSFVGRPCLFLDRDGVIVEETEYLHKVENVAFIDGVAPAIAEVNRKAIPVVVATNQSGIARGYYGWDEFVDVQKFIVQGLSEKGGTLDMVLACAYHENGVGSLRSATHAWRKPGCGMLLTAQRVLGIDLPHSFIIGDKVSDLEAGMAAGLRCGALTLTGHGKMECAKHSALMAEWRTKRAFDVWIVESPATAIHGWLEKISSTMGDYAQDGSR